jgi:hypothetical protein
MIIFFSDFNSECKMGTNCYASVYCHIAANKESGRRFDVFPSSVDDLFKIFSKYPK